MASLSEIKRKLEDLKNRNSSKKDKVNNYWVPEVGKYRVRVLVPIKNPEENFPLSEQFMHYGLDSNFVCNKHTKSISGDCPLCDKNREFWNLHNEMKEAGGDEESLKEIREMANKFRPAGRFYVPIYIKDADEVKYWSLSQKSFDQLFDIITTDEVDDFLSVTDGYDITVTYSQKDPGNRRTAEWLFKSAMKPSPAVADDSGAFDEERYEELLATLPDIVTEPADEKAMLEAIAKFAGDIESEDEDDQEVGKVVESAPVPVKEKSEKKSRLSKVMKEIEDQDDDF